MCFFFSSRRRHTRCGRDWSSDVCSSDLPAQRIGVAEALRMYTRNAAAALGLAGEIGQLTPGTRADAVLLSRDPLTVPPDDLCAIRVRSTFAGRWEQRADSGARHLL